jgi:hypothetical protein
MTFGTTLVVRSVDLHAGPYLEGVFWQNETS